VAVASNNSGSTPKDLFEDVAEELQKQVIIPCVLGIMIIGFFIKESMLTSAKYAC
jgi:hypothetical protein